MKYNPKEIPKKIPLVYNSKLASTIISIMETVVKVKNRFV